MNRPDFDAVVIGGGVTGTGVLRDLAMRGVRCLLVEQGDLCHGTSGRFHGLLHSGARYAVRDPVAARECIAENRIVRQIAPDCVEDTGGVFCLLEEDPEEYADRLIEACEDADIEIDEQAPDRAREVDPLLSPRLARALEVPDATINPFELAMANVRSAENCGARLRRRTRVVGVVVERGRVAGVEVEGPEGRERIGTRAIVNAAGPWAGVVAGLAGADVAMSPGWGVMVVMNERLSRRVVNRCRMPGDGDIVVPVGTVSIAGTTSHVLPDPEHYEIRRAEVLAVMRASAELIPTLAEARPLRVYAGARPLYDPGHDASRSRGMTRGHTLLDHAGEGVEGMVSIVGGKLTTYRLMAEETADAVCRRLGVRTPCATAAEPLPPPRAARRWQLGERLTLNEERGAGADSDLVCECELITRGEVGRFLSERRDNGLEDGLRGLRLGMGPCQAAFCAPRAAGLLAAEDPDTPALAQLADFLEERFRGARPVLWEDQARQMHLNEIVYREVFSLDRAPGV
ncbi:MAG TPA: anaerobic glycerol-3-phosphate dehydrogenase subunit GlpA [Candidatus Dormibacteraeota bacterium]|jgi:glycerol-3-phosphate dehydrogenase|nr:anaerobic glycerol-3-phosphate dehydrogenase subunit GlpA [Candidatus Dormibacteraeota bacterium]